MSRSLERLQKLIQRKVATVLIRDLKDPRIGLVTVTRVELTSDHSHCKVFWSTLEEGAGRRRTARGLEDARGFVQREVAGALHTRTTPHLEFEFDPRLEGMERISSLLREALEEDRRTAAARGDAPGDDAPGRPAQDGASGEDGEDGSVDPS
jgi:ribosome-binding factor A